MHSLPQHRHDLHVAEAGPATASAGSVRLALEDRLTNRLGDLFGIDGPSDELALARADRRALGAMLVQRLSERPRGEALLAPADVHRIVPRRTWLRRKADGELTGAEFDGLYRLVRLQLLATLVFDDARRAGEWLHTPKARLGGATPIDFAADTLGHEAVETWLHEIDQGFFA